MNGDTIDQIGLYLSGKRGLPDDVDDTSQILLIGLKSERNERKRDFNQLKDTLTTGIDKVYAEVNGNTEAINALDKTIHGPKKEPQKGLFGRLIRIEKCMNKTQKIALWIAITIGGGVLGAFGKAIIDYII